MNSLVLQKDKEYHMKLKHQKDLLLGDQEANRAQMKKLEEVRMEKLMGDNEYMKGLLDSMERRIKDQVQKKLSADFENKQWIERQLQVFKNEIVTVFFLANVLEK